MDAAREEEIGADAMERTENISKQILAGGGSMNA